ncbi:MAG: cytochrome c, partial [Chloroflexia bacterium]
NSPVRFPQVWDASWFTWVQYNASIGDPLVRNIGEALGVRAPANLRGPEASAFRSSINMDGLTKLEDLLAGSGPYRGLRSPKWPEVFPALDSAKVAAGERLYQQHCASCHLPAIDKLKDDLVSATPQYWVKNEAGKLFLNLKDIAVDYVGTDPRQAIDFIERKADTGDLGKGRVSAGEGLELVTKGIRDQYFAQMSYTPEQKLDRMGYRAREGAAVRSEAIYKARPLNGVWATAPYLHNGSVPSLFELIASKEQRGNAEFWPGTKRYDVVKVGYEKGKIPGTEKFDYSLPGNRNEGHYFQEGTRGKGVVGGALTDAERWALVEYLKSL